MILIPLGETDESFKKCRRPKGLIKVFCENIIDYLLKHLIVNDDLVYIPYNQEYKKYRFENYLTNKYPQIKFKFLCLESNTKAETINIALTHISNDDDCSILCLNSDNFYNIDIIKYWNEENCVFAVKDGRAGNIKVKDNKVIIEDESEYASTGAYGFNSYKKLLKYVKQSDAKDVSNVVKEMIENDENFIFKEIKSSNLFCLETPIQVRSFCNNIPLYSCIDGGKKIKNKRICFDLDNTLVTFPKEKNDYKSVEPIEENIKLLRYIKKLGNTIIIYTARRMKTHCGNNGKILADIGMITFETLKKFDIPFDEIYFGKPEADIYIDDLALNCFDNLEEELGYFPDKISPRDFNVLELNSIDTLKKQSLDLSGEIYYYQNIPNQIKDLFPLFIDYDINNTWYIVEKINGLTISTLYTSELLNIDTLRHIMNTIIRIQELSIEKYEKDVNIYSNYLKKLETRYKSYNYEKYKNNEIIYNDLCEKLREYEILKKGKKVIIHGDPVFTNIIINQFEKIKLIDMRGELSDKLTILGDWLYDWSKIYQSLIGYDEILLNKKINQEYKINLIKFFESYFVKKYDEESLINLKMITKSLLFTLIPLHNNEKCDRYFELINQI